MGGTRRFSRSAARTHELREGVYTDWLKGSLPGRAGRERDRRLQIPAPFQRAQFGLYVTPINIDPEQPAMPVSYPGVYSIYLAKKQGTYATLGLAEDTWALNEGVLSDDQFITQCLDMDNEREAMFLDALEKFPRGLVACVFDGTDRLQHTFSRD